MREFELIAQVFRQADYARPNSAVARSIGDDCALLNIAADQQLAVSTDSLLDGVHCPRDSDPCLLGQRALLVAVSDLAAMGATPLAFTLALSLPRTDEKWLREFSRGLGLAAERCAITLVGGDTTRGPLNIGVTVLGSVPRGQALLRSTASVGEQLWVSGPLGGAAAALQLFAQDSARVFARAPELLHSYWSPQPQLELGRWLLGKAGAAQDISDGLLADAGHIAAESAVRLVVEQELVPVSAAALALDAGRATGWALSGGDDYQLVFTLPAEHAEALQAGFADAHCIGRVEAGSGVVLLDARGEALDYAAAGYQHF